jgi:hypothetical protein
MTETIFSGSIIIDRPILEVYNYVADVHAISEWFPFYTEVTEITPRNDSKISFRAELIFKPFLNRGPSIVTDMTDYVPGRRISYRCIDIGLMTTVGFEPSLHGTLVSATQSLMGWQAFVFGLVAQPVRLIINDLIMQSLLSLKRRAESRAEDALPLIFFNYRRSKAKYVGGRIYDALCQEFGQGYVFRDFESIIVGTRWQEGIDKALKQCKVVVAHIGEEWEDQILSNLEGTDWVREELERALSNSSDVILIPVFTSESPEFNLTNRLAEIQNKLPDKLKVKKALVDQQGILLRTDPDFRQDLERLLMAVWAVIQSDKDSIRTSKRSSEVAPGVFGPTNGG